MKPDGTWFFRCDDCRVKASAAQKKYAGTEHGAQMVAQYNDSDAGKERYKRHNATAARAISNARYRNSELGQARTQRSTAKATARRAVDEDFAEKNRMTHLLSSSVSLQVGRLESPTLAHKTVFETPQQLRMHLWNSRSGVMLEWTWDFFWANYGVLWEIDHSIPQEAYKQSSDEDRRRCHSPENIRALLKDINKYKSWRIIKDIVLKIPKDVWPMAWLGQFPSDEWIEAFHESMRAQQKACEQAHREVP